MFNFKLNLSIFSKEFLLFCSALFIGIFLSYKYSFSNIGSTTVTTVNLTWKDLIIFAIALVLIIWAQKSSKVSKWFYRLIMIIFLFGGSQLVFNVFFNGQITFWASLIFVLLFYLLRLVLVHDLAMILGLAGLGSIIGLGISPQIVIVALIILSFYDVIAVYKTKHMVVMAKNMIQNNSIFGFIIPFKWQDFLSDSRTVKDEIGNKYMILGSGDIGLPIVFSASVMPLSLTAAILVAIFSTFGLFITHLMFTNQKIKAPMAALPPIATMAIIGYLISVLIL
jgi:presenilin-like A22 family membrane protease